MYDFHSRNYTDPAASSRSSRHSDESDESRSTAPTSVVSTRPSLRHTAKSTTRSCHVSYDADSSQDSYLDARSSTDTYASTAPSLEDLFEEPEEYDYDEADYQAPKYTQDLLESQTRPSTAQDFAKYFPSQRRLSIRHDDTTHDGNMNLRIETELSEMSGKTHIQLFHLRMHDLTSMRLSLRRYCRDSGRETCHSIRRYTKPASERPGIQRSMSNAFSSLLHKPDMPRTNSWDSGKHSPVRKDSGYASNEDDDDDDVESFMYKSKPSDLSIATNTIKLEFSNYAQVDVKRQGTKNTKRYEFEYWGSTYSWKRVSTKDGAGKSISYHLIKDNTGSPIAHIVPELRSPSQMRVEELAGGWVPPCSMWISDPTVLTALTDVADVIVATGLIALVDDCVKRHFSPPPKPKFTRQISLPLTPLKMDIEFAGPKTIVGHMFRRRNSTDKESHREHGHKQSPLRFANPVEEAH